MAELPSGTVTFLLTDVEGSTALWEAAPEAMRGALARHDVLIDNAILEHRGVPIRPRGEGDSRFVVFASAPDAVAAAIAIQRALVAERWPTPRPIKVRIGVHTGNAELRDGDYYGPAVNRCARLRGIGHGGQVLLAEVTASLSRESLPRGASLLDLGRYSLLGLTVPERVFQVVVPDLPSEFPPVAAPHVRLNNLPTPPTALLGRDREVADISDLLRNGARLVTLTGPGGIGKTRLSLQVAADLINEFEHGVFQVELAPVRDPSLFLSTVTQVLGVGDRGDHPTLESLKELLRSKSLLIVLDNFEQILAAAPIVAELLAATTRLQVLVTSRESLRLRGEREYVVPPLALPDARHALVPELLPQFAAVALFSERAVAVRGDFALTSENAQAVADICTRLDGVPLAIELAAARVRLLSPRAMVERMERRLVLLTGGARDLPPRQQTMRGAIDWSHELLDSHDRRLFRRLSVFAGGWTLDAADDVCNVDEDLDILIGLESLSTKSLVRTESGSNGETRFRMFETIREFGFEQLEACGEAEVTRRRYAAYFLALAESAEEKLLGREQIVWRRRLALEHDNLRSVLAWSLDQKTFDGTGLRLAGALIWYWFFRGTIGEGRKWVTAMLEHESAARTVARAKALCAAAWLTNWVGDFAAARAFALESAAIFRELGDLRGVARTLTELGVTQMYEGDIVVARSTLEEAVKASCAAGDQWGLAFALGQLGAVDQFQDDIDSARARREESASIARSIGDRFTLGLALAGLGLAALRRGDPDESAARFKETLVVSSELEDARVVPRALAGLASVASLRADHNRAAQLFGAVEALREVSGARELPLWRAVFDRDIVDLRVALGDADFRTAWAEGRSMTLEQVIAYALEAVGSA